MLKVSVIVPAYNSELYLAEALDSVIAQTFTDWECIIVDDGSTDGTHAVAQSYSTKDSRIKVFHQANQGPSMARNNGIRQSRGFYIVSLDSDDRLAPTFLTEYINYLDKHPDIKLVYSNAISFGDEHEVLSFPPFCYTDFIWDNHIFNYAMYRRSDWDLTCGYNPNMTSGLEDWDFYLSLLTPEDKVYCINKPLYYYRKRNGSRSETLVNNQESMMIQLYRNHTNIYAPYIENILLFKNRLVNTQKELEEKINENAKIRKSSAYRIGKILNYPLNKLKNFISHDQNKKF